MTDPTESTPLIPVTEMSHYIVELGINAQGEIQLNNDGSTTMSRRLNILSAMQMLSAPLSGAGSVYSTFGPIAIYYQPGLWLLAPVSTGAVISLTDAVFAHLLKRHPQSPLLNKLSKAAHRTNGIGIGYLANIGFHWNIFKTTAIFIGGAQFDTNSYAKLIAPLLSLIPAALTTSIRYKQDNGELIERSYSRHVASLLRGATSFSTITGILMLQGVIDVDSPIPMVTNVALGVLALTTSLCQEAHPAASRGILTMIKLLAENASLAALSFSLLNDIYAAVNDWEVSDEYFYTNLAINSLYYTILTVMTVGLLLNPNQAHNEQVEFGNDQAGSIEELNEDPADQEPTEPRARRHSFGGFGFHDHSGLEDTQDEQPEKESKKTPRGRSGSF